MTTDGADEELYEAVEMQIPSVWIATTNITRASPPPKKKITVGL